MKKLFTLIYVFTLLSVKGQNTLHPNCDSVIIDNLTKHFYVNTYSDNGDIASQAFYINDSKYKYVIYNKKKQIEEMAYLNKDKNIVDYKVEFNPNGLMKSVFYGFDEYFVSDSVKETGEVFNFIKLDGYRIFFYDNGNKKEEFSIINAQLNGEYKEYHENGALKTKEYYYNGVKKGMVFHYDEENNLIKTDTLFLPVGVFPTKAKK